jgi:hypothetical protein
MISSLLWLLTGTPAASYTSDSISCSGFCVGLGIFVPARCSTRDGIFPSSKSNFAVPTCRHLDPMVTSCAVLTNRGLLYRVVSAKAWLSSPVLFLSVPPYATGGVFRSPTCLLDTQSELLFNGLHCPTRMAAYSCHQTTTDLFQN